VEILETGLREALLRLGGNGGIDVEHLDGLTHNITLALKELQATKAEREKGVDVEDSPKNGGEQCDATAGRESVELIDATSPTAIEYLGTPSTNPSNSPQPKALFLPKEDTSRQIEPYDDLPMGFCDPDLHTLDPLCVLSVAGVSGVFLGWQELDPLGAYYGLNLVQ